MIFPNSCAKTGNWTHVDKVAPILGTFEGHSTDWATTLRPHLIVWQCHVYQQSKLPTTKRAKTYIRNELNQSSYLTVFICPSPAVGLSVFHLSESETEQKNKTSKNKRNILIPFDCKTDSGQIRLKPMRLVSCLQLQEHLNLASKLQWPIIWRLNALLFLWRLS